MGELILVRHGETEWSRTGRHTGRTDVPLTARGEAEARALAPLFARRELVRVLVSPAARAQRTARLAGLDGAASSTEPGLWEWDYGGYEGRTTAEIRRDRPGWFLWTDGVEPGDPGHPGESVDQVGARVDAVLARVRPLLAGSHGGNSTPAGSGVAAGGDVVVVAHGHVLRVLTARWLGLEPAAGRLFRLDTATVSRLGTEHDRPVIAAWNVPVVA